MNYSENNSFEQILDRTLNNDLLVNFDKREGSVIYNTLAPLCLELAEAYAQLDILQEQTYLLTATGTNLDNRAYDYGIAREQATQAQRIGTFKKYLIDSETGDFVYTYKEVPRLKQGNYEYDSVNNVYVYVGVNNGDYIYDADNNTYVEIDRLKQGDYEYDAETQKYVYVGANEGDYVQDEKILVDMDIPVGSRFFIPDNENIIFEYIGKINDDNILQCESAGTGGNEYLGVIYPINSISGLIESKITDTYKYGQDEETDESLRKKCVDSINNVAFGGNIPDYIQRVNAIDGVGNTKVFPAWNRNGGVLLSIVDPSFNPITSTFAENLKEQIDPTENSGQGYGFAPIGHYVTITTPVEDSVDVSLDVTLETGVEIGTVYDEIKGYIQDYFVNVRKSFGQDVTLAIYRARITEAVLKCDKVLNVTTVLLNEVDDDIVYVDTETINGQTLPYLGDLTIV